MATFTDGFQCGGPVWTWCGGLDNDFIMNDYELNSGQHAANYDVQYQPVPEPGSVFQVYNARNIQWDITPVESPTAYYIDEALYPPNPSIARSSRSYDGYVTVSNLPSTSHSRNPYLQRTTTPEQLVAPSESICATSMDFDQDRETRLAYQFASSSCDLPTTAPKTDSSNDPRPSEDGMVPRRQEPRFAGDEYTATWVRGEGYDRAGWCSKCSSWHKLKDSAYWYHMHYSHGISFTTGRPFDLPLDVRSSQGSLGHEALCGACHQWILIGRIERWRTPYFRHAHKCQMKNKPSIQRAYSRSKSGSPRKLTPWPTTPRG